MRRIAIGAAALLAVSAVTVPTANAASAPDLAKLVTVKDIRKHLQALQQISDYNGGNRQSGRPGYDISVKYVVSQLKKAGYDPKVQSFPFWVFDQLGPGAFEQVEPNKVSYKAGTEYGTYEYSGSGDVTAKVTPVDLDGDHGPGGSSGCEMSDFANFPKGNIALIRRGTCVFGDKAKNAAAAGASGVIIYQRTGADVPNDPPAVFGLSEPAPFPVLGTTYKIGNELAASAKAGTLKVRLKSDTRNVSRPTYNVLADTKWGRSDNVVVVGAHLDSVHDGAGINDNGSGSAAILAIAKQAHKLGKKGLKNKVRFAWWGAEEAGLLGSTHYVDTLPAAEKSKIALNLNFDMLGSTNFVRFVYDGDNSLGNPTVPPAGSGAIEKTFVDYFAKRGLKTEPTAFDGRSDYGPFIESGIPAGGLFSGAEGIKTPEQAKIYGGTAGQPYDPCYHAACDGMKNISWTALDQLSDGAAHATQRFARSTLPVNGEARKARALRAQTHAPIWKGGKVVR
ncbi:M28 family metallopeptidase [Actinomadura kijaniata]|uniref:M28 family metallopeptidase n=1 Tax=Actinomadura kijaniata TaxID=46161 RepID=UPI00082FF3EE|nr:M28 family metallopeptidase [Actinomadura kijaniata]